MAQRLNEAVATLCNADRRRQYDAWLAEYSPNPSTDQSTPEESTAHTAASEPSARDRQASATDKTNANSNHQAHSSTATQLTGHSRCPFCHAAYSSRLTTAIGYEQHNRCAQCKGAITPIEYLSLGAAEEIRKIYRHAHHSQAWLHTHWTSKNTLCATLTDFSIAGCAIQCAHPLPDHSVIMMDTHMLNTLCQVRYQKQFGPTRPYSIGLEFLTLDLFADPGSVFRTTA